MTMTTKTAKMKRSCTNRQLHEKMVKRCKAAGVPVPTLKCMTPAPTTPNAAGRTHSIPIGCDRLVLNSDGSLEMVPKGMQSGVRWHMHEQADAWSADNFLRELLGAMEEDADNTNPQLKGE
jgi:hypothetical protein